MAEAAAALGVGSILLKVLSQVKEVCNTRVSNTSLLQELDLFINNLERDLALLRVQTPRHNTSFWAAESLQKDLQKTAEYLERCLKQGKFKSFWSSQAIHAKLQTLRENLVTSFQSTLQIIQFDVAVQGQEEQNAFQQTLLRLHQHFLPALEDGITSIRQEMQAMRQERRHMVRIVLEEAAINPGPGNRIDIASAMQQVRSNEPQTDSAEKFFQDVLANLESLWSTGQRSSSSFEDPLSATLMCDPVKGTDGRTYDRWTIIDNTLVRSPYDPSLEDFGIVCDDIDARRSLFEAFPQQEDVFRRRRARYRRAALDLATQSQYADAGVKLKHVLQWDKSDKVCRAVLADIQRRFPASTSKTASQQPPRHGRLLAAQAAVDEVVRDLCHMLLLLLQVLLHALQSIVGVLGQGLGSVLEVFRNFNMEQVAFVMFCLLYFGFAIFIMCACKWIFCSFSGTYSPGCSQWSEAFRPILLPQPLSGQGTLIFSQGKGNRMSVKMETPAKSVDTDALLLQANMECPATEGFYFEVHVGFRATNTKTTSVSPGLGFQRSSWLTSHQSRYLYSGTNVFGEAGQIWAFFHTTQNEKFDEGDIIGAGTNFYAGTSNHEIYFTKNGEMKLLLRGVKEGIYRPLVKLTPGEVEVNFPHSSFKFNVSKVRDPAWRKSLHGRRYRTEEQPPGLGPFELVGLM